MFEVCRYFPKAFTQRRPDPDRPGEYYWDTDSCEKILYNLPQVIEASVVIVTEGEKDANSVNGLGLEDYRSRPVAATTSPSGAGKWQAAYAESLKGKLVVIIPDRDRDGVEYREDIERSLAGVAKGVTVVELP